MIQNDFSFCLHVNNLQKSISPLSFQLMPYMSMITLEACDYFNIHTDNTHLSNIRAKAKFLDDTKIDITDTIELLNDITKDHQSHFINSHQGLLAPLKRLIQPDIGEYRYNNHFIGTTILFNFYVSLSSKNTSIAELDNGAGFNLGYQLGQLIKKIIDNNNLNVDDKKTPIHDDNLLKYNDYKSSKYYSQFFNQKLSLGVIQLLQTYISMLNFVYYIFSDKTINYYALFKIRYITIFHVISSIKKLQSYFYKNNLANNNSDLIFQSISSNKTAKLMLSNKKFRNIMVHYKIDNKNMIVDSSKKLYGLVEHNFKNLSYEDLVNMINFQIEQTILVLESWVFNKVITKNT